MCIIIFDVKFLLFCIIYFYYNNIILCAYHPSQLLVFSYFIYIQITFRP